MGCHDTVSNVEHLFTSLWTIWMISLDRCLLKSSAHFLIELFVAWLLFHLRHLGGTSNETSLRLPLSFFSIDSLSSLSMGLVKML